MEIPNIIRKGRRLKGRTKTGPGTERLLVVQSVSPCYAPIPQELDSVLLRLILASWRSVPNLPTTLNVRQSKGNSPFYKHCSLQRWLSGQPEQQCPIGQLLSWRDLWRLQRDWDPPCPPRSLHSSHWIAPPWQGGCTAPTYKIVKTFELWIVLYIYL